MPLSYSAGVQAAGGLALVLPPDPGAVEEPGGMLARLDALILAGGADVDPASYGAEAEPETDLPRPERDRFELALAREALGREIPVLGICRGMQLLNVARGGTLVQHLPRLTGDDHHRHTLGAFGDHEVRLEPGSLAARAAGVERLAVKSHHHQALERMGDGTGRERLVRPRRRHRSCRAGRAPLRSRHPLAPGGGHAQPRDRRPGGSDGASRIPPSGITGRSRSSEEGA